MTTISARDASRGFAAMLDRVDRDGEEFTVVRDGRAVARVVPAAGHTVADFRARRAGDPPLDDDFERDVMAVRELLVTDVKDPWRD